MLRLTTDPKHGYYITVEEGEFADGTKYYTAMAPEIRNCLFEADTRAKAEEGLHDVIDHMVRLIIERGKSPPTPLFARPTTSSRHTSTVWAYPAPLGPTVRLLPVPGRRTA